MTATVAGLVTPHLLRVVDLANQAEKGINVDWHVRSAVSQTMAELRDQWNAAALINTYVEGLETAAGNAPSHRTVYAGVLRAAAASARGPGRE
ncbi:hypothetical protein [Cognatilysobacter bugurensis]|uniref:Uncharacterized protein n=1 Tax=Cognatilysobacter bugurensis TaxID=543356 RepID=A0A918SU92_9GAMM|nr:hypothetical protein [Lysobacter bugurensis]GHA72191.1 hypothetical protein GCM10007067_05820 [Lysobacter bugurensis]